MPNSGTAKTKSAPKSESAVIQRRILAGLTLLAVLTVMVASLLLFLPRPGDRPTYRLTLDPHPELPNGQGRYGGVAVSRPWVYYLRSAMTSADQQKGLSGSEQLWFNQGMIFVYDRTAERCFWMKEMRYKLDIIWVDTARKVTAVEHDVAPATYPQKFCHEGQYVIELNAGEAIKAGIKQGRKLNF